ncbi:unnamed protein product [Psylliodes chrysocephalus]|uniref:FAM234A/B beta-propeller domain-containing protein n=1 Tax=Psylliodes chrysocephalus TaxID=3402493 RepID=A0A9P0D876_9CUCU|nr:unnamed protein product [Psylliodes chrysocephala]
MKVSAYTGMNLRGEIRESISLDEDDLSDVEDEVFIRDGKNGYKFADDLTVKRPLMAIRRKCGRPDGLGTSRLKAKPLCKDFCRPCCYVFAALSILIGLIILVVVLVSIYPLPLGKFRDWLIKKSQRADDFKVNKLLPCDSLKVTDVWSVNLPKLTTDSPVRILDVNSDGTDDIIFGFGTGDNYNILPPDIFCPIFMGVPYPCEGGVIALNGLTGDIIWRHWFNDTIFSIQCTVDINGDKQNDCLVIGMEGTIAIINSKNGTTIWTLNTGRLNVFVASFIPDQNNDSVPDIIASHSSLNTERDGHLVLFSGKTGKEIKNVRTPGDAKIFYMPQILVQNSTTSFVIFGTGSPSSGGNLTAAPIEDISIGVLGNSTKSIYEDKFKGILTQSVLVDITGDNIPDIITAMYNSTLVAINGKNFEQIWNFTVPGPSPETNISPTPAYFNFDNVTDFLIIYQKYDDILNYNYTQTFIIDGKSGESMYRPITGGVISQSSGLTVSSESYGYDMYLFWTSECTNLGNLKKLDETKASDMYGECLDHSNNTVGLKLNALSQFHQPPGFVVYNSVERIPSEFNTHISILKQLKEYYKSHPKIHISSSGQSEVDEGYKTDSIPIGIKKYGASSFRHNKDRNAGLQNYMAVNDDMESFPEERDTALLDQDYDDNNYYPSMENTIPYDPKHSPLDRNLEMANTRDPRSKDNTNISRRQETSSSKKKNLSEKNNGIYDYTNVRRSRNRLLHDVDYVPTEILKDSYVKNEEMRLRKSRFEQRDVNTHIDKIKEKEEIQKIIKKQIEEAKKNESLSLWDLESEKEMKDWLDRQYRSKRDANFSLDGTVKVTSVGAILDSFNTTNTTNSFDIIFVTYWQPTIKKKEEFLKLDIQECIRDKLEQDKTAHVDQKTTDKEQRELFEGECLEEQANLKNEFSFFNQLNRLRLGQMTLYRLRIQCDCVNKKQNESCAKFLPKEKQSWPSYLGRLGDGVFFKKG